MLKSNKNASVKCLHTVFHCFWQCGYLLHYITWKQYISCPQTQNVGHKFYYFASAAYAASEAYVFVLSVAVSVPSSIPSSFHPMPNIFLLFHKNTEQISIKYAGGNHCHKQIKWLHFWGNRNRIRGKTWINVNRFCCNVKQVLMPSKWIHKCHCTDHSRCDHLHNLMFT